MKRLHGSRRGRVGGFTMVELMTTLTIIVILMTIIIPVVGRMRKRANEAATAAQISAISSAIEAYYQAFSAYPGPIGDDLLGATIDDANIAIAGGGGLGYVTGSENLVLGLLGGLQPQPNSTAVPPPIIFDQALVGKGPRGLNPRNPKSYPAFIDANIPLTRRPGVAANAANIGRYKDNAGEAYDSEIPEILDRMPNPMPILYMRARRGAAGVVSEGGQDAALGPVGNLQYDINHILGYTGNLGTGNSYIGEGKSISMKDYVGGTAPTQGKLPHGLASVNANKKLDKNGGNNYQYPYDAFPYLVNRAIPPAAFGNANSTGTPKKKDAYILISAGIDRVYGTADDITNFGNVTD